MTHPTVIFIQAKIQQMEQSQQTTPTHRYTQQISPTKKLTYKRQKGKTKINQNKWKVGISFPQLRRLHSNKRQQIILQNDYRQFQCKERNQNYKEDAD